jgi:hypothetical protein
VKIESRLFVFSGFFLAGAAAVYGWRSHEPGGTALLVLAATADIFAGLYLASESRRVGDRPEDRGDAEAIDGAGEVGFFPTASIWPLGLAGGAVVLAYGLVFGLWLVIAGGGLFTLCAVGYARDAQRHT